MSTVIEAFMSTWNRVSSDSTAILADLYHEDCVFRDPVHEVQGLAELKAYCERLYANVTHCHFRFAEPIVGDGRASVTWVMELRMTSFRKGELIEIDGISHIEFDTKIRRHRDYFDLGDLVYEHVPVLGRLIRAIKKRLQ